MDKNEFKEYEEQFYNRIDINIFDLRDFLIRNKEQIDKQKFSLKVLEVYVTTQCSLILSTINPHYVEEKDKYYNNLSEVLKEYEKNIKEFSYYQSYLEVEKKAKNSFYKKKVSNIQKMINYINVDMLFFDQYYLQGDPAHISNELFDISRLLGGVNVELFEEALINLSTAGIEFNFMKYVPGANIEKLEDKMVELRDLSGMLNALIEVKGTNKQKLRDEIIKIFKGEPIKAYNAYDIDVMLDNMYLINPEIVSHEYMQDLYLELKDIYNAEIKKTHVLTKNK